MVKQKWNLSKEKLWKIKQKEKRKINIHEMYLGKYLCGITSHTVPAMRLSVISSFNTIENSKSIILGCFLVSDLYGQHTVHVGNVYPGLPA